jgi:nitrile hydratase accessory protein
LRRPEPHANEPRLPPEADEPVFAKPWQATAFALTVALHERGAFSWAEWAAALGDEVRSGDPYYDCWMRALQMLQPAMGVAEPRYVDELGAGWHGAPPPTPHGKPILLENDPHHDYDH